MAHARKVLIARGWIEADTFKLTDEGRKASEQMMADLRREHRRRMRLGKDED